VLAPLQIEPLPWACPPSGIPVKSEKDDWISGAFSTGVPPTET
jgi:hypothetical protein